ncbi:MAG: tetratricopeptide repeat protein [Bacillati bacterium ANGP1]|uniref:Tetratricopeptide repeat protein n=1 Tax=Candidatus Segetimicrobium genomatis TaxID=2569760 RepID=A0A537L3C0_9BACT|nr:MAG: tetratricopeptide repeat protein [Terrabacteria group bacterium ANGP1]
MTLLGGACAHRICVFILVVVALATVWPAAASAESLFAAGREAHLAGRHLDAVVALRAYLTQNPTDAGAWVWLGGSYYQLGRVPDAVTCFERAMALQPSGETALWLGASYAQASRENEAKAAFVRASHSPRPQTALLAQQWLRAAAGRQVPVLEEEMVPAAYAYVVRWYNPRLDPVQVDAIVRSVLYYSTTYRVDPRLVMALIAVESGFRVSVESVAGASGLGQLMPETWRAMGINPADPVGNIYATIRVLRGHLDRYGSNLQLALAAYNAGHNAVTRYNGIPPFRETQWYVYNVMTLYRHLVGS